MRIAPQCPLALGSGRRIAGGRGRMIHREARGQTGTVVFDGEFVTIVRSGLSRLTTGRPTKRIALADISAVEVTPAGHLVSGYIRFASPGAGSTKKGPAGDENAVVFTKSQAS